MLNGSVLFDYGNRILGAAGPVSSMGLVFVGCVATRVVVEGRERARITKAFSTHVDPALVNYFLEHPEESLEGKLGR